MTSDRDVSRPLTVRFGPYLLEQIRQIAKFEKRSINNQILYFLERAVEEYDRSAPRSYQVGAEETPLLEAMEDEEGLPRGWFSRRENEESESSETDSQQPQSP